MKDPDLRILALADAKLLPVAVQEPFDQWRIFRARDAVASAVRKRMIDDPMLKLFLERLEAADDEKSIFEGIYALAQTVDIHRSQLGLHSQYLILIMSGHLNPWGMITMNKDFENPSASVVSAAQELWRLANENRIDVPLLLRRVKDNETLRLLDEYYRLRELSGDV